MTTNPTPSKPIASQGGEVLALAARFQFIYDDHVRPVRSGDDDSFPGLSWYDFGSSRMHPCVINARGKTVLKDGDWIVRIGTQYHAMVPDVYAALTHAPGQDALPAVAEVPGFVPVPRQLLESASESIGSFVSDHGWSQHDMDVMDSVDALLAAAPRAVVARETKL